MAMPIGDILDILRERGIEPDEEPEAVDLPGIGQVEEGETIYSTSVAEVFAQRDEERASGDDRLGEWTREIERVVESEPPERFGPEARRSLSEPRSRIVFGIAQFTFMVIPGVFSFAKVAFWRVL